MNEQSSATDLTSSRNADPPPQNPPGAGAVPTEKPKANPRRKMVLGALGLLILAGALWFGIPWVQTTLNTVSTDDAYVNGHVTFVAARVKGQVSRVLVDDNYRVRKGRPSGPAGQGALSGRRRDKKGGCRYGDGGPAGGQVQCARH